MADEIVRVTGFASACAQRILPHGEWAGCTSERLAAYEQNHCEVDDAEIEIPDRMPVGCPANHNGEESDDHKRNVTRVNHRYEVGCHQPKHRILVFAPSVMLPAKYLIPR